jgi:hypothetical protein
MGDGFPPGCSVDLVGQLPIWLNKQDESILPPETILFCQLEMKKSFDVKVSKNGPTITIGYKSPLINYFQL